MTESQHGLGIFAFAFSLLAFLPANSNGYGSCEGCQGSTVGIGVDSDIAADGTGDCAGSAGTILADWEIVVTVDVSDGMCADSTTSTEVGEGGIGTSPGCRASGCPNEVTYSWGKELPIGGIDLGYVNNADPNVTRTTYTFPDGDPYVPGEANWITFPAGASPSSTCGSSIEFFIQSHMCGDQTASVESNCSACENPSLGL